MAERIETAAAWQRPLPGRQGMRRDLYTGAVLVLATALSTVIYSSITVIPPAAWWVSAIWVLLIAGPLAVRRRLPAVVAVVVAVAFVAGQLLAVPEILFSNICLFVALYSLGAWGRNRLAAKAVRLVIIVGMFLWLFSSLFVNASGSPYGQLGGHGALDPYVALAALQVLQNLLYFAAAYFFGDSSWSSAHSRELLQLRTLELQAEREHSQRQAVVLERVRIARELHDVVAHHVSVMGLQAGAARRVLSTVTTDADQRQLEKAVTAVSAIEGNAREAVDDLHRLLGALRQPAAGESGATSGPSDRWNDASDGSTRGIEQLPQLVDVARLAGLPVEFTIIGEPRAVPPTTSLNLYRIAQEALTNCRKHAGPSVRVDVRLRYLDDAIELEVSDDGRGVRASVTADAGPTSTAVGSPDGHAPTRTERPGLGHTGMRERVDAAGGILELGTKARGGYVVRARLPLAKSGVFL